MTKTSLKRKKQIKKLADMSRNQAAKKIKKFKKITKPDKTWIENHLKNIVQRKPIEYFCSHVLVGSSSFVRFLRGQFNIKKAHGFLHGSQNQKVGLVGEQAFATFEDKYFYQTFGISKRLPFLCTTADFIVKRKKILLIEVKTAKTIVSCETLFENTPIEYLFQIWITLEIFGLDQADLMIYHYDENAKKKNKYGMHRFVSLYGIVHIQLKYFKLLDDIKSKAIEKYLDFLKTFFSHFGSEMTNNDKILAKSALDSCFEKHKRISGNSKNINQLILKRNVGIIQDECRKIVSFDPNDERNGTESRRKQDAAYFANLKKCLERRLIQYKKICWKEKKLILDKQLIEKIDKLSSFLFED
jgi:hypothetical protein